MRKLFFLLVLASGMLVAQTPNATNTQTIGKFLKLSKVPSGLETDNVLVRGTDGIVKFVPRSEFAGGSGVGGQDLQSVLNNNGYASLSDGTYTSNYTFNSTGIFHYVQENNDSYGINTSPWYGFFATSSHRLNTENSDNESNSIQLHKQGPVIRRAQYVGVNGWESVLSFNTPISNTYYNFPSPVAGGSFILPLSVNGNYADNNGNISLSSITTTFTTNNGKTVTVTNGVITNIQ